MALDSSDAALAEKLKREDPEQFHTLVRMHLSFVLDLNTDESDSLEEKSKLKSLKWTFAKKVKSTAKGVMEGAPLTQEGICQVYQLIEYLSVKENIAQEGIFRRTGKLTRQQDLKSLLNQGVTLNLNKSQFSVHDCASVLKSFLAELPEPLLTEAHFPAYYQLAELCSNPCNEAKLLRALQLLFLLLPSENSALLKDLLQLLHLTASHEITNKMSAHNLATLFTPHLLCPRKLTPEAFRANSQAMSGVVAFMILKGTDLLCIPVKLAADIRAYWAKKESRRRLTPQKELDESISDGTATAATIFTFLDRESTSKGYTSNPTDTALAELYAHVQSLPESSQKRRLIKQYNKANGNGTPLQIQNKHLRSKSLGDSIKKHIFHKNMKHHRNLNGEGNGNLVRSVSQERIHSQNTDGMFTKRTIFQKSLKSESYKVSSCNTKSVDVKSPAVNYLQTSNENNFLTSSNTNKGSRPSLHTGKKMAETPSLKRQSPPSRKQDSESSSSPKKSPRLTSPLSPDLAQHTPIGPITGSRHHDAGTDSSSSPRSRSALPGFFTPLAQSLGNTNTNKPGLTPRNAWSTFLMTSTPAPLAKESDSSCLFTPIADDNNSMSPITRSTQRMPKAMQETMMTPRSRKPVLALSGTNLCQLANLSSPVSPDHVGSLARGRPRNSNTARTYSKGELIKILDLTGGCRQEPKLSTIGENSPKEFEFKDSENGKGQESTSSDSITTTFRSYLFSRSVLTASPVDLSFSSRTGDFDSGSLSDIENLTREELSDSLMYCLDGNLPQTVITDSEVEGSDGSKTSINERVPLLGARCTNKSGVLSPSNNDEYLANVASINEPIPFGKSFIQETSL